MAVKKVKKLCQTVKEEVNLFQLVSKKIQRGLEGYEGQLSLRNCNRLIM